MKSVISSALAVGIAAIFSVPALASSTTCGNAISGGVFIEVTVPTGSPSCLGSGNGTVLNTVSDPFLSRILDTTQTGVNGPVPLSVTFSPPVLPGFPNTDGSFSFNTTGFQNFAIGFQLNDAGRNGNSENPDWFIVGLPNPAGSGSFDADVLFGFLPSNSIQYAVLYGDRTGGGNAGGTPLPAALPLFASGMGGLGFLSWRRKKRKAVATH